MKKTARSIGRVDQLAARGDGERLAAIGVNGLGDLGADLLLAFGEEKKIGTVELAGIVPNGERDELFRRLFFYETNSLPATKIHSLIDCLLSNFLHISAVANTIPYCS
ncbi:MAG: hypothetical protein HOI02_06695, partial [Rhodospirillaceae bacterium]|nr:hypothetical protein [Rhodospirillaceae bacterium]